MKVGDPCKVVENCYTGERFEWDGVVTQVTDAFIETKHCRNRLTHPQWEHYQRAYLDTWIKHYFGTTGTTPNILTA